ncbi:50S ribosomal protein L18 [Candidatus Curtissbacteria bacterium RIFCSPHIGHO2_01_FULL_41_11]|uniref:Large ribosomal subunit protein uL18 n=1 Tax=Candidatus Curtissbacteria bacterium RIFCSPHIGHO2_01_FULL_41_11 TaxID=1797711 RepID=A0A1F5G3L7_9BACT|nr:MAG: 50S ribosomal protein L18 [Candidatus Curtissbacteria bacterium RIFCSPHIGHO2_01_FULL_41_11]
MKNKRSQRIARHARVRRKVEGTESLPRLSVFRSNKYIYAQLIDDKKRLTIVSASDVEKSGSKTERAKEVGKTLASAALKKNVKKAVFDRAGYKYHGRIKALAEGAREGGLAF